MILAGESDPCARITARSLAFANAAEKVWAFHARGISVFLIAASAYDLATGSAGRMPTTAWWKNI